jgi:lipoprotein-anchoring transpeptidase ErfK/SrfK
MALAIVVAGCGGVAEPVAGGAEAAVRATPAAPASAADSAGGTSRAAAPAVARAERHTTAAAAVARAGRYETARVLRRTRLRAAPAGRGVATIAPRTRFGSLTVLAVVGRSGDWLEVHAAELPNGRTGWLPAAAVRLGAVDLSIRVDRSARTLAVRRGGRVLRRFTVAVGRPGNETPTGRFAVTDKLAMPPGTPYGCCAVALTGHQTNLPSGWSGGDRLAVHGTDLPESVGQAISLGCMRAYEPDIRWLMRNVPLGTPVFVRA